VSSAPVPDRTRTRLRAGAGAVLVLALLGAAVAVLITALSPHGQTTLIAPPGPTASAPAREGAIYVHILGEVVRPGLYALHAGDRGVDAVAAAGGFTPAADPAALNLARPLDDGEQIVIPVLGEAPAPGAAADGRVNLNAADVAALDTLPGIGPAKAQGILDWREQNGRFTSVDDLLDVPGIGASTLERLRDLVTV
jgi:competence protein ComEA